jgi:AcrR family transcriptional regulator
MPAPDADATRERILASAYAQADAHGLAQATVEGVAQAAGLSRATIYRHFPGGKEELVEAVISWEVARFFDRLGAAIDDAPDFASWLARGLLAARRQLEGHTLLQRLLEDEADQLVPHLVKVMPIVRAVLRDQLAGRLARERLRAGVDRGEAAELLARLLVSYIGTPGVWRLDDPAEAERLVRTQLLPGVVEPTAVAGEAG